MGEGEEKRDADGEKRQNEVAWHDTVVAQQAEMARFTNWPKADRQADSTHTKQHIRTPPPNQMKQKSKSRPTHPIDRDYLHLISLSPEEEHQKSSGVHSAQTVRLPGFERQGRVFVEADFAGGRVCMRTRQRGKKWGQAEETYQE